jgi:hypothetical protein
MVLSPDAAFANIVPIYIKNINRCINLIYEDMVKFSDDEIKALPSMAAKK